VQQFYHQTYAHHFLTQRHYHQVIDLRKDELMKTLFLGALNKSNTTLFDIAPAASPANTHVKFALPTSWEKYSIDHTRLNYLKKALEDMMHRMLVQQFALLEGVMTWEAASEFILDRLDMPDYPLDHLHRYYSRYGSQHLGMDRKKHKELLKQHIPAAS
jgi:hypothetical protein